MLRTPNTTVSGDERIAATQTHDAWSDVVQLVNGLEGDRPLAKIGAHWAADLLLLLGSAVRTLAVLGATQESVAASVSRAAHKVQVLSVTLPALTRHNSGVEPFPVTPDLLIANCKGFRSKELGRVISLLCGSSLPTLLEFDSEASGISPAWFSKLNTLAQVRVLDVSGDEIDVSRNSRKWEAGCLALLPKRTTSLELHTAIITRASRTTGVPRLSQMRGPQPYNRTVEVVSLQTAARLAGFRYERRSLPEANYNIYSRKYDQKPAPFELAWCQDVDLIPHPAWKVCVQDKYFVEEIGYSNKNTIFGMEYWPEFQGYWHIRRQSPHIYVPRADGPFLLLGGDNAYYHWLLNWVPRLMAVDVMADHLPPLQSLKWWFLTLTYFASQGSLPFFMNSACRRKM